MENTTEEYYYYDDIVKMTPGVQIPSAIGLTLLIIVAIAGNSLTVLAYAFDRKLHTVYNFYILNLAITDLLLSCASMPFYAVYTLTEFTWPFGMVFCKIWLVMDFTLCFESILLMLILSLDRLLLIVLGSRYAVVITMKVAGIQMLISWLVSFTVYGPAIIGWDYWEGYSTVEEGDCDVEFAYDFTYTTATGFIEFILPFVLLSSLNTVIYCKIRQRSRVTPRPLGPLPTISNCASVSAQVDNKLSANGNGMLTNSNGTAPKADSNQSNQGQNGRCMNTPERREAKAARLLAILVVVFLVCWAPYTITTVIISFCDECVNTSLYEFFNWVLWIKSAVNPLLYAYNSVQYRNNFQRLLTCNRRKFREATETSANRTDNTNM